MTELSHLYEAAPEAPQDEALAKLTHYAQQYFALEDQIEKAEDHLKKLKAQYTELTQEKIPHLLSEYGLSELRLANGRKVTVSRKVSVSVKDMNAFAEFLMERGEDDILKTKFFVDNVPPSVLRSIRQAMVETFGVVPEVERIVHPQTLKKWVSEVCRLNKENSDEVDERFIPVQDLPSCIKAFVYYATKIK